jgi:hypothetical protein
VKTKIYFKLLPLLLLLLLPAAAASLSVASFFDVGYSRKMTRTVGGQPTAPGYYVPDSLTAVHSGADATIPQKPN